VSDKKTNLTRWQRVLWRLGFAMYANKATEVELLEAKLATVRGTLAMVRKERDRAFLLLRAARIAGDLPLGLTRPINGLVALESEGDIEEAGNAARALLAEIGWMGR
jgi:hypothetical protein